MGRDLVEIRGALAIGEILVTRRVLLLRGLHDSLSL